MGNKSTAPKEENTVRPNSESTQAAFEVNPQPAEFEHPTPRRLNKNGTVMPKKVKRNVKDEKKAQPKIKNIAAIDFGTANCSLAYFFWAEGSQTVKNENIHLLELSEEKSNRVPTAVLIDQNGQIIKLGKDAEDEWNAYCDDPKNKDKYFFFKQIKMELLRNEIEDFHTVKAANGKECFLIEVIAIILKYIKNQLIEVKVDGIPLPISSASDFNWVITVPAIWKPNAKQVMREAAYMAGIASGNPEIQELTVVRRNENGEVTTSPYKVNKNMVFPERLSLALEPEAAALHCMKTYASDPNIEKMNTCLVVDIGGGTVDISAITKLAKDASKLKVVLPPKGNEYGGKKVNEAILKFIGKLVNDPDFEEYKKEAESTSGLLLIEQKIEEQKCSFGKSTGDTKRPAVIRFPESFYRVYMKALSSIEEEGVTYNTRLEISYNKMKEFFDPAIVAIKNSIDVCFRELKTSVEAIFLVGGFGACNFVYKELKTLAEERSCKLYRSPDNNTAVVVGAVMFQDKPEIFRARIADATYGTDCCADFNPKYGHGSDHLMKDDDGKELCEGLFSLMIQKGEELPRDEDIVHYYVPAAHGMTAMNFQILASDEREPFYALNPDESLHSGIHKIGNVRVPMPDPTGDKDRTVKLTFDFSDTEIHVQAYDETSKEMKSIAVNFFNYK